MTTTNHTYEYSAGNHPHDHCGDCRFEFPKHQSLYHQEWRLVATDLADDYHSNHDGWEASWPIEFRIYKDAECVWKGDIEREMEPAFYVV